MKLKGILLAIAVFTAANAYADIYQWKDKAGNSHMTDSLEKVPQEYRRKVEVRKTSPVPSAQKTEAAPSATDAGAGQQPVEQTQELYGDKTLDWWKAEFEKRNKEIGKVQTEIDSKREFISIFEMGRRLGQMFEAKHIETYERNKKEVVDDEAKLVKLKEELDELRRQARFAGVPKEIRGE